MIERINERTVLGVIPKRAAARLKLLCEQRRGGVSSVSEVHLTVGDRSSFVSHGERVFIGVGVCREDMVSTMSKICEGALYAHRDTINRGYITLSDGIRVGISGLARYEGGSIVGVSEISSLVFRIPTAKSSLANELAEAYQETEYGMIIFARAGGGKTTALRTLSGIIAEKGSRVVVVDERCEFSTSECERQGVLLMRGYKREEGMEIALRTLAPDVIMVDEIGGDSEAEGMLCSLNSGVRLIATAHAKGLGELKRRPGISKLIGAGVFDTSFGIFHTDTGYSSKFERLKC